MKTLGQMLQIGSDNITERITADKSSSDWRRSTGRGLRADGSLPYFDYGNGLNVQRLIQAPPRHFLDVNAFPSRARQRIAFCFLAFQRMIHLSLDPFLQPFQTIGWDSLRW